LYPPVDGDVVNFDPSLCREFFDVATREAVAEVPVDSEQDHLRRIAAIPEVGEKVLAALRLDCLDMGRLGGVGC